MNKTRTFFSVLIGLFLFQACSQKEEIILSCEKDNDLFVILKENSIPCSRFDTPREAIAHASEGSGVMVLADGYPGEMTPVDTSFFNLAQKMNLRVYLEYPSYLPDITTRAPRGTHWERAVVASDAFNPELEKMRIIAIQDCRFIPADLPDPDIVVARVAGFDRAVYGLPPESYPILAEFPLGNREGSLLVSTTKLSQFVTARYAPADAWQAIWKRITAWVQEDEEGIALEWKPEVRPAYGPSDPLPADAEKIALQQGIDWYFNSRMIISPLMMERYNQPTNGPHAASADPDMDRDWPFGHRVGWKPAPGTPEGDGSLGVLEGFDAHIFHDGNQPVRWWRRNDCNGETAGALGLAGMVFRNEKYLKSSENIGDWLFFESLMSTGDRSDPAHPAYGLLGWNDVPEYTGPGSMNGYEVYYGDDNARGLLGMILAARAGQTDRYDERFLKALLGNLRVSGVYGFQPNRIDQPLLEQRGWEAFFESENTSFSPHYQANMWACYLWAWNQTGFDLFLERAKIAIEMTMNAYPDQWTWTNGIQQERAKMLLPLAWLVRVEDTPSHREWLKQIAGDLLESQDASGAIAEKLGVAGKGGFPPPASNEAYGTTETPLIQSNEDGVSDLLYTVGFAFLGLHEAAAATDDPFYRQAEDKLAEFLCRIQIHSEKHPELNGGWFRAFDFNRWEYWASNGDAGWGAWCIESGWSQSWITSVLALRQLETSVWDMTRDMGVDKNFESLRNQMIPAGTYQE